MFPAQDTLVDAVENAEVAEIKRAVFRALTRLRAATIKERVLHEREPLIRTQGAFSKKGPKVDAVTKPFPMYLKACTSAADPMALGTTFGA